jgi:Holliday junction resolvase-like predicted endonuclease
MNDFSPDRAGVLGQAARLLESHQLRVLDRDWKSGVHALDLVAAASGGVLVAVVVKAADLGSGGSLAETAEITDERADEIRRAAWAWTRAHGIRYCKVRVDVVAFYLDGTGGHVEEAG